MLEVCGLTKYYEHTPALRDVSFTIRRGEILGYLGSNGAGKSTTVKILTGMIEPSQGRIFFDGRSVHDDFTAYQYRLGYVPEEAHLYPHLSGWEYLQLAGRLRGMPRRILEPRMEAFLRSLGLWDERHDALSAYSKGMRQKILLSAALLHNPDVLILDEPFSGLDSASMMMLRKLLHSLANEGKMILFSSHVLDVVEKVCTDVLILRKGEVVAYDSICRLRELMSQPSLEGVFAQLTQVEDGEVTASRIVDAMKQPAPVPERPRPVAIGLRMYRAMADAYPHEFRNVYGEDLLQATEDSIEWIWRRHGAFGLARLLLDIAVRIPSEYLDEAGKDIRIGLRKLGASPGFTLVALLSLSLGICIVTCALSQLRGMALRALPEARDPERLVGLQAPASYPNYRRFREQHDLFETTMAYAAPVPFSIAIQGQTERTWGHLVSDGYFSTIGLRPVLGSFVASEHQSSVVVSNRFWQNRLGGDPSAIGSTIRVNGQPVTIAGIAPPDFLGASPFIFPADVWMPLPLGVRVAPELANNALERRDVKMFYMVGRLRPGVTFERAEAELDAVGKQLEDADKTRKGRSVLLVHAGRMLPLRKQDLPFFTSFLTIIVALIMAIACANVANMMLARAADRRKEMAVRLALGASRARLVRQLLMESLMLSLSAGVIGFVASAWLMTLNSQLRMPFPMPVAFDLRPDWQVFALTTAVSIGAGLLFGMAPALHATATNLAPALKEGTSLLYRSRRPFSLRNVLMVSQVAGSLTLLVIIGPLSLGIQTTLGIQAGFNPKSLYSMSIDPVRSGYSGEQSAAFFETLLERVKANPSITAATLTETVPVSMPGTAVSVSAPGDGQLTIRAVKHTVGRGYFDTTGIAIVRGRSFRRQDETEQSAAVIVSEALARHFGDPLGRSLEIGNSDVGAPKIMPGSFDHRPTVPGGGLRRVEVIGVAADVAEGLIVGKPRPALYFPMRPSSFSQPPVQGITLLVRSTPGFDVLTAMRREVEAIDSRIVPFGARSMDEQIAQFMAPLQTGAWTYAVVGIFGLVLASVGLAGVTAYSVAKRSREIGIRIALGARNHDVLLLVMKEGFTLISVGTAIGMAGGWTGSRMLAFLDSSVGRVSSASTTDPAVLMGAPVLLAALALIACYVPARRSARIDPSVTLRME